MKTSRETTTPGEWLLAAAICIVVLGTSVAFCPDLAHWFVLPVLFCGILMTSDVIRWARGKLDLFDVVGILGLAGTHFFFIAPILQIMLDYRTLYVSDLPDDYRPLLGGMAALNAAGLLLYRHFRNQTSSHVQPYGAYSIDYWRFSLFTVIMIAVCLMLQAGVVRHFGGIAGFVDSISERQGMEGMGLVFMFTEALPMLIFMWCSVTLARNRQRSWAVLAVTYAVFLALVFLFAGLRGSRSNTIWAAIWGAGIIHFYNRRLNRGILAGGAAMLVVFMYVYGFYKDFGKDVLDMFESSEHWAQGASRSARTYEVLLLSDFGRTDVQALILHRLTDADREVSLAWGRTYLAAATLLIPQFIWPERPAGKTKYMTDIEHGAGTFQSGLRKSSKVAGITGEAMLNFGWIMAVGGLAALGFAVRLVRRYTFQWAGRDSRGLLMPYFICLVPFVLMFDSDNLIFELVTNLVVPGTLILLSSRYSTTAVNIRTGISGSHTSGVRP